MIQGIGSYSYTPSLTRMSGKLAPETPPDLRPSSGNRAVMVNRLPTIGRQLRGFGAVPDSTRGDTWAGTEPNKLRASEEDDYVGNGIFDGPGAPPTGNAGSGVFESHFALPGNLYRERPNHPSEVIDATTGMPVVFRPAAGASSLLDVREAYDPWDAETERLYSRSPSLPPLRLPEVPSGTPFGSVEGDAVSTDWATLVRYGLGGALVGLAASLVYRQFFAPKGY